MPYKGTKKNSPNAKQKQRLNLETNLYDRIERLARSRGIINPRNGDGNRSKLIELAVDSFDLFSRTYPESLPYPQEIIYLLDELERAIADKDLSKLESLLPRIIQNREYLESWGAEVAMEDAIADGTIKLPNNSYIV